MNLLGMSIVSSDRIESEAIERGGYSVLKCSQNKAYALVIHERSGRIFEIRNDDGEEVDAWQVLQMIKELSKQ